MKRKVRPMLIKGHLGNDFDISFETLHDGSLKLGLHPHSHRDWVYLEYLSETKVRKLVVDLCHAYNYPITKEMREDEQ